MSVPDVEYQDRRGYPFDMRVIEAGLAKLCQVNIRRDGREVRPQAEELDGKTFWFCRLWVMTDEDPYPGEVAWEPSDTRFPKDSLTWIASGDLDVVYPKESA